MNTTLPHFYRSEWIQHHFNIHHTYTHTNLTLIYLLTTYLLIILIFYTCMDGKYYYYYIVVQCMQVKYLLLQRLYNIIQSIKKQVSDQNLFDSLCKHICCYFAYIYLECGYDLIFCIIYNNQNLSKLFKLMKVILKNKQFMITKKIAIQQLKPAKIVLIFFLRRIR